MNTLFEVCKPRESVFDETKRDDTLDLSNLIDQSVDAEHFFSETYVTDGMKTLFDTAFNRFEGKAPSGLIKLTQSMGGGKTHNMVALGLLAQNSQIRKQYFGSEYSIDDEVNVVAYTGRESDIPYGIWGEIARQLGKEDVFKDYYSPLKAPGQSAWTNLLKSEKPTLILLDELPPYLEYSRTIEIGTGTLADVTTNALANLFNALGKSELHNVCLVISDLQATYEMGSSYIQKSFKNLENEIGRSSINIEPVGTTSDDLYHILRKRLFTSIASETEIQEVAQGYKEAVKESKQMSHTNYSPEQIFTGIKDSYPFHPSIKDLFARFKENQGFQQTRGFIRLTRIMVKHLYQGNESRAKNRYLLNPFDLDLEDSEMFAMVKSIKPKLSNAISHDITTIAKDLDRETGNEDAQEMSKLLLLSSLGDATNARLGLSLQEAIGILSRPGRVITEVKTAFEEYKSKAWYLYEDRNNLWHFKDVKNVNAELNSLTETYTNEIAKQEIKKLLEVQFKPFSRDCYQEVAVFPAVDEIELKQDQISLILFEPNSNGVGLKKELKDFHDNVRYKNRVLFLTGQRNPMEDMLEHAKQLKAINAIIKRMKEENVSEGDSQYQQAQNIKDKINLNFLSTTREAFITLYYPVSDGFEASDFKMEFKGNEFNAEEQIRNVLIDEMKFDHTAPNKTFRKKFEKRIFTQRQMRWRDLKERAATDTSWSWHPPKSLEELKEECLLKGLWVEEGGYVDKEPPLPETSIQVREVTTNDETGEVTLKITPQNGDKVYYEINDDATTGSSEVTDLNNFQTNELYLSFLCVDSTGAHEIGPVVEWKREVKLKHRLFDGRGGSNVVELKATSPKVKILYTTDGSNPKNTGGVYEDQFEVPIGTKYVQAIAVHEELDIYSEPVQIPITDKKFEIDRNKQLKVTKKLSVQTTSEVYKLLEDLNKFNAEVKGLVVGIEEKESNEGNWLDLNVFGQNYFMPSLIEKQITQLRSGLFDMKAVNVSLEIDEIKFNIGQDFEDWLASNKEKIEKYKNYINQ
ncbi:DUF499 domain-containing protein [Bacillus sp. NTK071]|uniref:DUF499 domain-containing protein n=1 Tax=Bacillus sp. NTK071 TaxID=2802175 RepID=UPI001A8D8562|nr:DUF499 domain-containing protein [Bacillus sp. NTK071]MBN8209372.1 DUF499 domain-containing protein [Bacillus sp. NTK071]